MTAQPGSGGCRRVATVWLLEAPTEYGYNMYPQGLRAIESVSYWRCSMWKLKQQENGLWALGWPAQWIGSARRTGTRA